MSAQITVNLLPANYDVIKDVMHRRHAELKEEYGETYDSKANLKELRSLLANIEEIENACNDMGFPVPK